MDVTNTRKITNLNEIQCADRNIVLTLFIQCILHYIIWTHKFDLVNQLVTL